MIDAHKIMRDIDGEDSSQPFSMADSRGLIEGVSD